MVEAIGIKVKLLTALLVLVVSIHVINMGMAGELVKFGILPRHPESWFHIFFAPFIHGSVSHLIGNLTGLAVFSAICILRSVNYFMVASLFIIVVTGTLVWIFGRSAVHIGASGWVFGLWSLCITRAWFDRKLKNIVIAITVVLLYGGMIYGLNPNQPGISYEAHIAGVLAGILFSGLITRYPGLIHQE